MARTFRQPICARATLSLESESKPLIFVYCEKKKNTYVVVVVDRIRFVCWGLFGLWVESCVPLTCVGGKGGFVRGCGRHTRSHTSRQWRNHLDGESVRHNRLFGFARSFARSLALVSSYASSRQHSPVEEIRSQSNAHTKNTKNTHTHTNAPAGGRARFPRECV